MRQILVILLFFYVNTYSQSDSLKNKVLSEIEITQIRPNLLQTGIKKIQLDSIQLRSNTTLADILQSRNYLQIQSYSPGQLASPSFRGSAASHTAVLWNGFNLQSAMNGQADLSLIQNAAANHVKIQFGGGGALYGSGAIGGVIHLQNQSMYNQGISSVLRLQAGSFSNFRQQAEVEISKKNYIIDIKLYNHTLENDFKYTNIYLPDNKLVTQQNAAISTQGLVINNSLKTKNLGEIKLSIWTQQAQREIAPTMLSQRKKDAQNDLFFRSTLNYSFSKNSFSVQARAAYFIEKIQFNRFLIDTSTNLAKTVMVETEFNTKTIRNQSIYIGLNHNLTNVNGSNINNVSMSTLALFSSYKFEFFKEKLNLLLSARQQLQNYQAKPIAFGIGSEFYIYKNLKFRTNLSKNFRLPTFNDLYWTDASGAKGNKNLKPESGWSSDLGLEYNFTKSKFVFQSNMAIFSSKTNDWISWRTNNIGQLSPQNIQSVWSRGLEYGFNLGFQTLKFKHNFVFNADYTVATIDKVSDNYQNLSNKQLIYVPYNKCFIDYNIIYKNTRLSYQWTYTGFRYSTEDNEDFLPAFSISNISLFQDFVFNKWSTNVFIKCNNIFNTSYQIIAARPMYGIHFNVGINIKFVQPNKS